MSDPSTDDEPQAKRQKSSEPPSSVSDKVAAEAYQHLEDMAADILSVVRAALAESSDGAKSAAKVREFRDKAMDIFQREKAYPRTAFELPAETDAKEEGEGEVVLSVSGLAPHERRLFSSLPLSHDTNWSESNLPVGVSFSRVLPASPQERTQTLGELFAAPRTLLPLQPPKQPKTQAKGTTLDFYHPELTDHSKYRSNTYFSQKLSAGQFLDYSHATPSAQTVPKQHERAQSLAGKKPSTRELEVSEMESLFRGAFSSFAPTKDDSAAVVPSNVAGRLWWRRVGQRNLQSMIEVEYYDGDGSGAASSETDILDEAAVQDAIDNWDEDVVDPSLEDVMGVKRDDDEKDADEILDEVSDLIETLASYQRIRNLTLPNSQNRQSSDPVNGDMLATAGPQLSEEEQATYQVLKAQLALIIKTLPPFAVAKLNGEQLEDLLISTKVQVQTDQYKGVMEEDDLGVQARLKAQQQAAQANPRPAGQRTPSISGVPGSPYVNQYTPGAQYGTPNRAPSHPQQYYRAGAVPAPNFQQQRPPSSAHQQPRPQPNQYSRPNGYPNSYATQLAKAQTPYGHQSMPQYAGQQRPQYGQMPQQGTPNMRFPYQQGYPQQPGTPTQGNYGGAYTNGAAGMPPRTMSPQVPPQRPNYSPSPNMQQQQPPQRFTTPNPSMSSQMNRFSSNPSPGGGSQQSQNTAMPGYHTHIPEAQQQRILDQAKARVAAQERTASFTDKIAQPQTPGSGLAGIGLGGTMDASRLAAARAQQMNQQTPMGQQSGTNGNGTPGTSSVPTHKITPVPVPAIPGLQRQPSS